MQYLKGVLAGPTKKINVGCHPTSIWQLLQVIRSFMVPSNEDGQYWSLLLSRIISDIDKITMRLFYDVLCRDTLKV